MQKIKKVWQMSFAKYLVLSIPLLIPLYFNSSYWAPFSPAKYLLMTFLTILVIFLYSWGKIVEKKDNDLRASFSTIDIGLIVFGIVLIISGIFGFDVHNSFIGNIGQSLNIILILKLILFTFFVRYFTTKDVSFIRDIISVSFITSIIVAIIAYTDKSLISYSTGGSTIGNTSYLGAYLLFNFIFGIYLIYIYKKKWIKFLLVAGLLIIAFNPVYFNNEIFRGIVSFRDVLDNPFKIIGSANGAVIGLIVSVITIVLLSFNLFTNKYLKNIGNILFISFMGAILTVGILFANPESKIHQWYVQEKSPNRFVFWEIARSGFIERPLLGWGPNNYDYVFQKNFDARLLDNNHYPELWVNQPHNIVWDYLVNTGILGLLAYLLLFGSVIIYSLFLIYRENSKYRFLGIVTVGILIGYFVQNLFVFDTITTYLMYFMIIGIISGISIKKEIVLNEYWNTIKKYFFAIILIVSLPIFYYFFLLPIKEVKQLGRLTSEKNIANISKMHNNLSNISYIGGINDTAFIFDKFSEKIINLVEKIPKKDAPFLKKEIDSFIQTLEVEIEKQPNNFRSYIVLAKLSNYQAILLKDTPDQVIYIEKSKKALEKAQSINPVNVSSYLLFAQAYSLENNLQKVIMYSRASIAIAPQYDPVYEFADQILSVTNDYEYKNYVNEMKIRNNYVKKP